MKPSIIETRTLFSGWTRLLSARIRLAAGGIAVREIEDHGRAVAVLPYDEERGVLLLVRLLRAPALYAEGAADVLETPAGLVEDEEPEAAARREVLEETGYRVRDLDRVASAWTSPGLSTEKMDLFLARYSQGDREGPGGGVAGENENIEVVEMPAQQAWAMLEHGEIEDMKTLALLLFLRRRRPALFEAK